MRDDAAAADAASDTGSRDDAAPEAPPLVVVMGVSGSGKTTVGLLVADRLSVAFVDGDDLHPPANVARIRAGIPLTDDDRRPWLARVGAALAAIGRLRTTWRASV